MTDLFLAVTMMLALNLYALMGGADYGGGVWDLFSFGPNKKAQRELIAGALAPIWEANHVWLILVIVVLFSAFPPAFAALSVALHIPLTLLLLGMIFRGTAFTFRRYDSKKDATQERWGMIFSVSSLFTPVILGIIVGAITQGSIAVNLYTHPSAQYSFFDLYVKPWVSPFCFAVGGFALVLFSFLAAVYLSTFADSENLKEDYRKRAIVCQFVCAILALVVFLLADNYVPPLKEALLRSSWSAPVQAITAICALFSLYFLFVRRYIWARTAAALQVTCILWGWGLSQYPYLIRPDLTIYNAAGAASTQKLMVVALCLGACLLVPSFVLLFRVFKHDREHLK